MNNKGYESISNGRQEITEIDCGLPQSSDMSKDNILDIDDVPNFEEYAMALLEDDWNGETGGWAMMNIEYDQDYDNHAVEEQKLQVQKVSKLPILPVATKPTSSSDVKFWKTCSTYKSGAIRQDVPFRRCFKTQTKVKVAAKRKWCPPKQVLRIMKKTLPKRSDYGPRPHMYDNFTNEAAATGYQQAGITMYSPKDEESNKKDIRRGVSDTDASDNDEDLIGPSPPTTKNVNEKDRQKILQNIAQLNIMEFTAWLSDPGNRHPMHQPTLESEMLLTTMMEKPKVRSAINDRLEALKSNKYLLRTHSIKYFYLDILDVFKAAIMEELETQKRIYYGTVKILDQMR